MCTTLYNVRLILFSRKIYIQKELCAQMALAWLQLKFFWGVQLTEREREKKHLRVWNTLRARNLYTWMYCNVVKYRTSHGQIYTYIPSVSVIIIKISAILQYCLFDQTSQIRLSIALSHVCHCAIAIVIIMILVKKGEARRTSK